MIRGTSGVNSGKSGSVTTFLVPFQHRELFHRFAGVDADVGVPAGCGEGFPVGAVGKALLTGMLCWRDFDGFEIGVPDGLAGGEGVFGYVCVGGAGDVVVFAGGDGH